MTTGRWWCDQALIDGVVHERVAIEARDGRFTAVVPGGGRDPTATHLSGLTLPGLANAHSHAFHRALRGRTHAGSGSFWTWRDVMYRAAERLDPDGYFRLARATFAEMAMSGVSTVGEFHYVHHQPGGTPYADPNAMGEALLAAAADVGLRITLLDTLYLHGGLEADGHRPPEGAQLRFSDGSADRWAERVARLSLAPSQRLGAAVHSVRAVDAGSIRLLADWARDRSLPIHAHLSEQPAENRACRAVHGASPTELLHDLGVLGPSFTAVHATHLTADDIALLGGSGSSVCCCPTTERDLADGIGPSRALVGAGARLCLGSDSHAVIDLFEEARAVELDERLVSLERGTHPAGDLLHMATATGHLSLGWTDAGSIRVGHRADLTTVSLGSVRTAGSDPAAALETVVFAATAADVTDVVVDGRSIVTDGHHRSIDAPAELATSIRELFEGDVR